MTARSLQQLIADGETEQTLQSALDALDEMPPTLIVAAWSVTDTRNELLQELKAIRSQGSLF